MKTTAAILWQAPGAWDVREVDLDEPREGEVLVKVMASGLCHSDDHFAKGDMQFHSYPRAVGMRAPAWSKPWVPASPASSPATMW